MRFQVASIQFAPDKGQVEANIRRMGQMIVEAAEAGADLVLLPELATCGYDLEDAAFECALEPSQLALEFAKATIRLEKVVDIAVGFYEKVSGKPYNSMAYLTLGNGKAAEVRHVYRKFFPPTYGIFDEGRYQRAGSELGVVDTRFGKIGLLICEDVWHSVLSTLLGLAGCSIILVSAASPARGFSGAIPGNVGRYEGMLRNVSSEHGVYTAIAMLTGFESGKGMSGGSMILGPTGNKLVQADILGEQIVIADVDTELVDLARNSIPLLQDVRSRWQEILVLANQVVT